LGWFAPVSLWIPNPDESPSDQVGSLGASSKLLFLRANLVVPVLAIFPRPVAFSAKSL